MDEPDKGWSWVIAFSCCFASLVLAGIFRTSGVLFVAFISTFGVTREEASWPMVVCIAVLNLTGPFSGILGQKFGSRPIIIIGAIIATTGIASCYFTTSLKIITLLFGVVFGIGYGFMNTLMPVILNAYFLNLRATANGIANSGSCIGSLVLPVVFEYLIATYGLSGCFLLTGGIVLHIVIVGSLMRPPPWLVKKRKYWTSNEIKPEEALKLESKLLENEANVTGIQVKAVSLDLDGLFTESGVQTPCLPDLEQRGIAVGNVEIDREDSGNECFLKINNIENKSNSLNPEDVSYLKKYPRNETLLMSSANRTNFLSSCVKSDVVQSFIIVLTCPMFYITAITNVSFYFLYHMYVVIIVDYSLDRNVPDANTKYILFAFSIADLFGRLCLGWITDRKLVTRPRFVMGCMMMIGFVFFTFPFATSYHLLILVSCCYGLLLGCTMVVFPILLVDFCGSELHAVAYGCMCFMNGFSSFGRPFLIGYFRDSVGSYSNMFYILGIISVAASTLWLLEICFAKKNS